MFKTESQNNNGGESCIAVAQRANSNQPTTEADCLIWIRYVVCYKEAAPFRKVAFRAVTALPMPYQAVDMGAGLIANGGL